eukprot:CAMPEP_0114345112 /NCGR_PEP_ID=MMETSP0101-20121206/11959_1 /TAXON_ID=38822 ORGANISM="Pteridomonas danica, Strain PT" /NCGR_SAMPLE_ID=MMETSP0101 /ASSEMBLY_ACC=CAM_ASM_000211 /LENGTH=390 /DNA_ID=CAMNT_0001480865 /DNA_START=154 /DNA_END=1326 /DNA_ORIENTATION=-
MTKAEREKIKELKRNWNKSSLSHLESQKQYQRHIQRMGTIKPQIDTRPPFVIPNEKTNGVDTHAVTWNKNNKTSNHGREWAGTFVYENSLLSPREKHRISSWKGTEKQIPRKIYSPFTHDSADINPPSDSSVYAHGVNDFEEANFNMSMKKNKNNTNTNTSESSFLFNSQQKSQDRLGTRPSSAPRNRSSATPQVTRGSSRTGNVSGGGSGGMSNKQTGIEGPGMRSVAGEGGEDGEGNDRQQTQQATQHEVASDKHLSNMRSSFGSGTKAAKTFRSTNSQYKPPYEESSSSGGGGSVNHQTYSNSPSMLSTTAVEGNDNEQKQQQKQEDKRMTYRGNGNEELLIDRLPPIGLEAYDTLCQVLSQLDPKDRVKVVECALIDSGEMSKMKK